MKKLRKAFAILTVAALIISTALLASACGGSKPSQTDWPTRAPEAADNNEPAETEPAETEPAEVAIPDSVKIDETTFPDANFRKYVFENFDANGDWELSKEEISIATEIETIQTPSIKGIEYFTELQKLSVDDVTELDLSNNTKLKELTCIGCEISGLDLSKNTELTRLNCSLCDGLTELDLSKNTELEYLDCHVCNLTKLDLSNNTKLEMLYCSSNSLSEINLSNCAALHYIDCQRNNLTFLDVNDCSEGIRVDCEDSITIQHRDDQEAMVGRDVYLSLIS